MMDDQPKQPNGNPLLTAGLMTFVFGPGIGGTIMWLIMGDPVWLFGWLITLIVLLAG